MPAWKPIAAALGVLGMIAAAWAQGSVETTDQRFEFFDGPVKLSKLKVEMAPGKSVAKDERGLILPLKITNGARETIYFTLTHEWHGGLWPTTCLFSSVTPEEKKDKRDLHPVYLAGEDPKAERALSLAPGKSMEVELRMDWPGTGSVKTDPLIKAPGKYDVRFALVFRADGQLQHAISPPTIVEYEAE